MEIVFWFKVYPLGVTVKYLTIHDGVTKWKLFSRYWPFVRRLHRSPVNSPHKGPVMRTLMSLRCAPHKLLNKQSNDLWSETSWRSFDVIVMLFSVDEFWNKIYSRPIQNTTKSIDPGNALAKVWLSEPIICFISNDNHIMSVLSRSISFSFTWWLTV